MSVQATSSNNTAESNLDIGGKQYDYYRPQLFVFYACIKHLLIDLARMPLLGNAVFQQKFIWSRKIYLGDA